MTDTEPTRDPLAARARRLRRGPLLPPDEATPVETRDPAARLPHRPPLLLLDTLEARSADGLRVRARRRIDPDDPVFAGHFPGDPVYPGVLLVEMIAQAALTARPPGPGLPRFTRIRDAAFFVAVRPGDTLEIHAEAAEEGWLLAAAGQVWRDGELCAIAIVEALLDE